MTQDKLSQQFPPSNPVETASLVEIQTGDHLDDLSPYNTAIFRACIPGSKGDPRKTNFITVKKEDPGVYGVSIIFPEPREGTGFQKDNNGCFESSDDVRKDAAQVKVDLWNSLEEIPGVRECNDDPDAPAYHMSRYYRVYDLLDEKGWKSYLDGDPEPRDGEPFQLEKAKLRQLKDAHPSFSVFQIQLAAIMRKAEELEILNMDTANAVFSTALNQETNLPDVEHSALLPK